MEENLNSIFYFKKAKLIVLLNFFITICLFGQNAVNLIDVTEVYPKLKIISALAEGNTLPGIVNNTVVLKVKFAYLKADGTASTVNSSTENIEVNFYFESSDIPVGASGTYLNQTGITSYLTNTNSEGIAEVSFCIGDLIGAYTISAKIQDYEDEFVGVENRILEFLVAARDSITLDFITAIGQPIPYPQTITNKIDPSTNDEGRSKYIRITTYPNTNIILKKRRIESDSTNCGHEPAHHTDSGWDANWRIRGGTSFDSGVTNVEGILDFRYKAPPFAGDFEIKVEYTGAGGNISFSGSKLDTIVSRLEDTLVLFPETTGVLKVGGTDEHQGPTQSTTVDNNHWCTDSTSTALQSLAAAYYSADSTILYYNDMSLPFGGKFDINGEWYNTGNNTYTNSHEEHFIGINCDIQPEPDYRDSTHWSRIKIWLFNNGFKYKDEIDPGNHIHFRLYGIID